MLTSPRARILVPTILGLWLSGSTTWEWHQDGQLDVRQWWLLCLGVFMLFTGGVALAVLTALEVQGELSERLRAKEHAS